MSNFSSAARLRLNIHAWALLVLVIIEVLTNFLSDNLTVGQLTPNEQLMPHRLLYDLWLGVIIFRGIFDGRYKLIRYFGMGNYNLPASVQQLLADNDVALYDLQSDPEEMDNLANPAHPRYDEALLSTMNQKLNALIAEEIGEDKAMFTPPEKVPQK